MEADHERSWPMGPSPQPIAASVNHARGHIGLYNTMADVDALIEALKTVEAMFVR